MNRLNTAAVLWCSFFLVHVVYTLFVFFVTCSIFLFCSWLAIVSMKSFWIMDAQTSKSLEIDAFNHFTRALLLCERGTIKSEMYVYAH